MTSENPPFTLKLPKFVTDAKIEEIKFNDSYSKNKISVEYEWIDISNILPEFHRIAIEIVKQTVGLKESLKVTVPLIAHVIAEQFVYFLDREVMLMNYANDYNKFEKYTEYVSVLINIQSDRRQKFSNGSIRIVKNGSKSMIETCSL